jgi:hypothetical protein
MLLLAAFALLATPLVFLVQQRHQLKKRKRADEAGCTLEESEEQPPDKKSRSHCEPELAVLNGKLLERILSYLASDFLSVAAVVKIGNMPITQQHLMIAPLRTTCTCTTGVQRTRLCSPAAGSLG